MTGELLCYVQNGTRGTLSTDHLVKHACTGLYNISGTFY
jgi:hypothetical protein